MANAFIRKLEHGARLTGEDRRLLERACRNVQRVPARTEIIHEGDEPANVHLILDGFAMGYRIRNGGERQIVGFLVPGDICDLHVRFLGHMDHCIGTLVDSEVAQLAPAQIEELTANPRINRALWWCTLVDEAILREWLATLGRQPADQQLAHIFCELMMRLRAVGRADADGFDLPFRPEELAGAMSVTRHEVRRALDHLCELGLARPDGTRLRIPDLQRLKDFSGIASNYLQMRYGRDMGRKLTVNQHVR